MSDTGANQQPYEDFGAVLANERWEGYGERFRASNPDAPRLRLTALAVANCINRPDYPMTPTDYAAVERVGGDIPEEPEAFVAAVSQCLLIEPGSPAHKRLETALAARILGTKYDPEHVAYIFALIQQSHRPDAVVPEPPEE